MQAQSTDKTNDLFMGASAEVGAGGIALADRSGVQCGNRVSTGKRMDGVEGVSAGDTRGTELASYTRLVGVPDTPTKAF